MSKTNPVITFPKTTRTSNHWLLGWGIILRRYIEANIQEKKIINATMLLHLRKSFSFLTVRFSSFVKVKYCSFKALFMFSLVFLYLKYRIYYFLFMVAYSICYTKLVRQTTFSTWVGTPKGIFIYHLFLIKNYFLQTF